MEQIQQDLINSVNEFIKQYRESLSKEEFFTLKKFTIELKKGVCKTFREYKEKEMEIQKIIYKVWEREMTDFDSFDEKSPFKFVVTCPTVPAEKYEEREVISASLITNRHLGTFNNIQYGIVCEVTPDNILGICKEDMHSVLLDKPNEDIERQYFYLNTVNGNDIYSKTYVNSIQTPRTIEAQMMVDNVKANGNFLVRNHIVYSDILLDAKKTKKLGVFLIEPCEEYAKKEAYELAKKYNLTVKRISLQHYYELAGLISKSNKETKKHYDIKDIDAIFYVIENIMELSKEYNNLIIDFTGKFARVKDEETGIYFYYNSLNNTINLVIPGINHTININVEEKTIEVDGEKITKEQFQELVSSIAR